MITREALKVTQPVTATNLGFKKRVVLPIGNVIAAIQFILKTTGKMKNNIITFACLAGLNPETGNISQQCYQPNKISIIFVQIQRLIYIL